MLSIVLLSTVVVLAIAFYFMKNKNRDFWKIRNVKYIDKTNPFGIFWNFVYGEQSLGEIYKDVYDKFEGEPYVGLFLGSHPMLLIRSPENIQAVFASAFHSFNARGIITNKNDVLADNVLFIDDFKRWKLLRQKVSPVFTSSRLKKMFYIMEHCAKDFAAFVAENPELQTNPFDILQRYNSAAIGASVFGIDTQTRNSLESPFIDMAWEAIAPSFRNNFRAFFQNSFPGLFKLFNMKLFGRFEKFFLSVFEKALETRRSGNSKSHDFIDLCLELQQNGKMEDLTTGYSLQPTAEVLAAQAFFFFLAGIDTSSNTTHFTLIELARNPDILERLHKEIDEVFENGKIELSYDDIENMTYLDAVLNESMRKYPTIALIQRICTQDTVLPDGGLKIDKGTYIVTPVLALHRDSKYYENPEVFNPERFSDNKGDNLTKFTYLPFGAGNRLCIGARFARLQMKVGLAWLLKKFTLKPIQTLPKRFEKSVFSLRASEFRYTLLPREGIKEDV